MAGISEHVDQPRLFGDVEKQNTPCILFILPEPVTLTLPSISPSPILVPEKYAVLVNASMRHKLVGDQDRSSWVLRGTMCTSTLHTFLDTHRVPSHSALLSQAAASTAWASFSPNNNEFVAIVPLAEAPFLSQERATCKTITLAPTFQSKTRVLWNFGVGFNPRDPKAYTPPNEWEPSLLPTFTQVVDTLRLPPLTINNAMYQVFTSSSTHTQTSSISAPPYVNTKLTGNGGVCSKCGTVLSTTDKHCISCGAQVRPLSPSLSSHDSQALKPNSIEDNKNVKDIEGVKSDQETDGMDACPECHAPTSECKCCPTCDDRPCTCTDGTHNSTHDPICPTCHATTLECTCCPTCDDHPCTCTDGRHDPKEHDTHDQQATPTITSTSKPTNSEINNEKKHENLSDNNNTNNGTSSRTTHQPYATPNICSFCAHAPCTCETPSSCTECNREPCVCQLCPKCFAHICVCNACLCYQTPCICGSPPPENIPVLANTLTHMNPLAPKPHTTPHLPKFNPPAHPAQTKIHSSTPIPFWTDHTATNSLLSEWVKSGPNTGFTTHTQPGGTTYAFHQGEFAFPPTSSKHCGRKIRGTPTSSQTMPTIHSPPPTLSPPLPLTLG